MIYVPMLDRHELTEIAADVRQLVEPWSRVVWRERYRWTAQRNKRRYRERVVLHYPPLLDQLRMAVHPGAGASQRPGGSRAVPGSRPPVAGDPSSRLAELYVELAAWHGRIGSTAVSREADWQKAALGRLVAAAAELERPAGLELARDVRRWWRWAAVQSGWSPDELLEGRGHG